MICEQNTQRRYETQLGTNNVNSAREKDAIDVTIIVNECSLKSSRSFAHCVQTLPFQSRYYLQNDGLSKIRRPVISQI